MKKPFLFALFVLASLSATLTAQRGGAASTNPAGGMDSGATSTKSTPNSPRNSVDTSVGRSVAASMPLFRSAVVQPVAGAPFSGTVLTQWKHFLPDGSSDTVKSRQIIARDSSGRVFQEWRVLSANGDKKESALVGGEYIDPVRKTHFRCTIGQRRECVTMPFAAASAEPAPAAKGLGSKKIDGFDTTGSRQTVLLGTGADAPKEIVETWYSPQLQLNLLEKHATDDDLDFTVKDVKLAEPDPQLFTLPVSFSIVAR